MLESIQNALLKRYQILHLPERAGASQKPITHLIDMNHETQQHGLSQSLENKIEETLNQHGQVLLFLNRRGYAPVLYCTACKWSAHCDHCSAHMCLHQSANMLLCHHCGKQKKRLHRCPECHTDSLKPVGIGTEQLADYLRTRFPSFPCLQIDHDTTRQKNSLENSLTTILEGKPLLILGTQMLAKGHHFPEVRLVGIIDADSGLLNVDFRAHEQLAQLLMQVSGRAGRKDLVGHVYIQTHYPQHPVLQQVLKSGYSSFTAASLTERQEANLPPYSQLCLFRSEAKSAQEAMLLLDNIKKILLMNKNLTFTCLGPSLSPMEKRQQYYRMQLLVKTQDKQTMQQLLSRAMPQIYALRVGRGVKWNLDVDPIDLY